MSAESLAVKSIEKYLPRNCPFRSYVGQRDTSTSCKLFSKVSKKGKHIKTNKFLSDENKKYFLLNKHVRVQFNHTKAHTMLVTVASFYGKSGIVYCYQCKAMFGNFTCLVLGLTVIAGSLIYPVWRALRADKHCLLLFAMFI
jgi:hypothetical protein